MGPSFRLFARWKGTSRWPTEKTAIGDEKRTQSAPFAPAIVTGGKRENSANHREPAPDPDPDHGIVEQTGESFEIAATAIESREITGIVRGIEGSGTGTEDNAKEAGVGIASAVMIVAEICYLVFFSFNSICCFLCFSHSSSNN